MLGLCNKISICGIASPVFLVLLLPAAGDCAPSGKASSKSGYRPVYNYDLFENASNRHSHKRSRIAGLQSELAMLNNDVDRAIAKGKSAVERDPDDMDARIAYGEALFAKVKKIQAVEKCNPAVFNECVKTWLIVHRNLVGEESEMSYKGISIPLANKFFEDEQRSGLAKLRLRDLCGRLPKFYETNTKYLKCVLMPETSVSGNIIFEGTSKP